MEEIIGSLIQRQPKPVNTPSATGATVQPALPELQAGLQVQGRFLN
jgi:hypothetical protein